MRIQRITVIVLLALTLLMFIDLKYGLFLRLGIS